MKRTSFYFCLFLIIILTSLACSNKKEIVTQPKKFVAETVEVQRLNQLEKDSPVVFTDSKEIRVFTDAIKTAVKVQDFGDMQDPMYKIIADGKPYFLWIINGRGTIMNTQDAQTSYYLLEASAKAIEQIFTTTFPAIKKDGSLDMSSYINFPMDPSNVGFYIGAIDPTPIEDVEIGVYVNGVHAHGDRQAFQIFSKVSQGDFQKATARLEGENLIIDITSHKAKTGEVSHPYVIHGLSVKEVPRYYVVIRNGKTEKKEEIAYGIE